MRAVETVDALETSVRRWLERGLVEWVGGPDDPQPRISRPDCAEFLPRLAAYIGRQTSLVCTITWTDA